jgi:pimeloyl-ACP methyl ester carboxylesterase
MRPVVLVHGAFRGGWAWEPVLQRLHGAGIAAVAPTLTGCEADSDRVGTRVHLAEWIDDVVAATDEVSPDGDLLLVAHSQGGLVATAALDRLGGRAAVLHLDAAVPADGERGVDLNPPGVPPPPPDLDPALWIPARPVGPDQGFTDEALAAFVNDRLAPTPVGPSLDPVSVSTAPNFERYVFFADTPHTYPCWTTRARLDARGVRYTVMDGPHDAPLVRPDEVAAEIARAAQEAR